MQEIWCNKTNSVIKAIISEWGFKTIMNVRQRHGGGLAIIFKPTIKLKKLPTVLYSTFELQKFEVVDKKAENFCLYNVYHPPNSKNNPVTNKAFLEEFEVFFEVCDFQKNSTLVGDINLRLEKENETDTIVFNDLLDKFALKQHVTGPTHEKGSTLDVILTTEESIVEARVLSKIDSDHFPILFSLPFSDVKRHKKDEMRTFRSRKNFDIDKMKEKLANINWSDESDDPEQSVENYNRKIFGIYNEMCPLVTRKVAQKGHPWYDGELKASKVVLKKLEKKRKFGDF